MRIEILEYAVPANVESSGRRELKSLRIKQPQLVELKRMRGNPNQWFLHVYGEDRHITVSIWTTQDEVMAFVGDKKSP